MANKQPPQEKPLPLVKAEQLDPKRVNQQLLARILNVDVSAVRLWEQRIFEDNVGPFPVGRRELGGKAKIYNLHLVIEWYIRYKAMTDYSGIALASTGDEMSYDQAKAKKEVVNWKLSQIELDRELGNLIPRDDAKREWSSVFAFIKGRLLNLTIRLASLPLDGKTIPEKADILDTDIRDLLNELSTNEDLYGQD